MSTITFVHHGDFGKTEKFLRAASKKRFYSKLDEYGKKGVEALAMATPKDSGKTASSWSYDIHASGSTISIVWNNSNVNQGVNIAVIIQSGHGTGTGGYVKGIDYINPTMKPVFDDIANAIWKEVERL